MDYLSWNGEMPEKTFPDTGAILAKRVSDALRQEAAKKVVQEGTEPDFPESIRAEQRRKSSPTNSYVLYSSDYDLLQEDLEQRLRRVIELEEAVNAGSQKAVFELQEMALRNSAEDVRVAAIEALGTLEEQMPVVPLLLALRDSFWDVRAAAAQALGKLGKRTPIRHLVAHLKREQDMSVREAIVRVMGQQGSAMPVGVIVDVLLRDESWLVREAAASALGELREHVPLPALIYALRFDPTEQVRVAAAASLGQVGEQGAMTSLFEALEDDDSDVRDAAALALQQLEIAVEPQEPSGILEDDDLSFLEEWFSYDMPLSEVLQRQKDWLALSALIEYIKDKRGGVKFDLKETVHGRVLLIHFFYKCPEESLQETLLPSIREISGVEPIEAALQSRDDLMQSAVKKAFERRGWLDLLVVSFVVSHTRTEAGDTNSPFRVIVCSMSCQNIREQDVLIIDQLSEQWHDIMCEPLVCECPHHVADLKVWYQSVA